jgi:hypothetical protein
MLHNNNYHKDNKKPYRTPSTRAAKDIQQQEGQMSDGLAFFDSFPQDIKNIIARLRITVDHIDSPRNYARDLIHELARQLDERRLCKRGHISIKIKEILEDKIQAGKITKEWISECLPEDYKRKYTKTKSKLSLLSKQYKDKGIQPAAKQDQEELAALKEKVLVNASGEEAAFKPEESPLITASPTLPQSIDTHVEEDPTSSDSMSNSSCEKYSPEDIRIKKLQNDNTELRIRCQRAESNNTKLVLQLTHQGRYINELLNQNRDKRSQPSSTTDVNLLSHPSGQECTSCLELQDEVTQLRDALQRISIPTADQIQASGFEFIIPKEEYEMVKDAMDKSKSAIFVKCDGSKKFVCALADVDN